MSARPSTSPDTEASQRPARAPGVAIAAILGAAACWGALGISYEIVARHVQVAPVTLVTLRATAAALILLAFVGLSQPARRDLRALRQHTTATVVVAMGLISTAAFYVLLIYAYREAGVSVATVLLYVAPAIVAVMAWVVYRLPVSRAQRVALVVAFAGVVGVAAGSGSTSGTSSMGIVLGLLSAVTYASYSLLARFALQRLSSTVVVTASLSVGAGTLWIVKLIVDGPELPSAAGIGLIALVNGVGTTIAPMLLYTWGLAKIGPGRASLVATAEPAIAVVLAFVILDERMSIVQAGGALAIAAGVVIGSLSRGAR